MGFEVMPSMCLYRLGSRLVSGLRKSRLRRPSLTGKLSQMYRCLVW